MTHPVPAPRPPADETAPSPATSFAYVPALDGLRAVAVGAVMAFHFGAGAVAGGFLGVDTFFVLSGYLITSLLLIEWRRSGTLRFAAFWARRARRLFPALFLMLLAVAVWARFAVAPDRRAGLRADMLWTLFYGANWHFIDSGQSYFALVGEASPLRHAWSLAIEEQFYLFWPLISFGCLALARGRARLLAALCAAGIAVSTALMAALAQPSDPMRVYYGTDTHASPLLVGAALAIGLARGSPRTPAGRRGVQLLGLAGAAFSLWAFTAATERAPWLYRGGFLVFALATASVIAAAIQPDRSPLAAALSARPVRWIGRISYGLYLWHWFVAIALSPARTGLAGWELAGVRLAVTFGIATLSYYLVEQPIRRGALRGWVARGATAAGLAAVAAVTLLATSGATELPEFLAARPSEVIETEAGPGDPGLVLLLGDSVAASLGDALQREARRRGLRFASAARPGCGMVRGIPANPDGSEIAWARACADATVGFLTHVSRKHAPRVVLWLSTWEAGERIVDGRFYRFSTPDGDAMLLQNIEESRRILTADGARLMLLTIPPRAESSDMRLRDPVEDARFGHLNRLYREFARANADSVGIIELAEILCPGGPPCPESLDGVRPRPRDGGHFEGDGPGWLAPRLLDAVVAALAQGEVSAR